MATSTLGNGTLVLAGTTSGTTTVTATAVAGTTTLTLPAATDTLVGKATTDTLTNKTLTGAAMNGTLGATTPSTASVTTLTTSSTITHNGGTANGVAYLDGSKVLTTGSALVFDGTNLGVGVTPPAGSGDYRAINLGVAFLYGNKTGVQNAFTSNADINDKYVINGYASYYQQTAGKHIWTTAASGTAGNAITFTQAMTLSAAGELLVGTTTASYTSSGRGNITLGGSSGALYALQVGGTQKGYLYHDGTDMYLFSNASGRITITAQSSGVYLANGGTSWTSNSDERKKDIIEPILNAATKVSTLRAVIGKYKTDNDGRRRSFLIAQDVQAVLPEAVDASNPDDLGIQYTEVIPLLVAAIKEQQALITTLTDRITALENK